MKTPKHIKPWH